MSLERSFCYSQTLRLQMTPRSISEREWAFKPVAMSPFRILSPVIPFLSTSPQRIESPGVKLQEIRESITQSCILLFPTVV